MATIGGANTNIPEGWTDFVPPVLRRTTLGKEFARTGTHKSVWGDTYELDLGFDKGGAGYAFRPRSTNIDKEQAESRGALRVKFGSQDINKAAFAKQDFIADAAYPESFNPKSTVISRVEYSPQSMILRVTFANNGSVVAYSGVPPTIYARLYRAHTTGQSVGGTFWNLVRVYDRRNLPMPTAQGDPSSWAAYKPKSSNFVREGSKYAALYLERGPSLGPRPSEYRIARYDPVVRRDVLRTRSEASRLDIQRLIDAQKSGALIRHGLDRETELYRRRQARLDEGVQQQIQQRATAEVRVPSSWLK